MAYVVCCLKRSEVHLFIERGQLPDCANSNPDTATRGAHPHVEMRKAFRLVGNDDGHSEAVWVGVGCRMLYQHPPKVWKGKMSGGTRVMQMVEIRGRSREIQA